jgi:hypothetical protein
VPGWGAALISIVLILVVGAAGGWVGFTYWRARVSYENSQNPNGHTLVDRSVHTLQPALPWRISCGGNILQQL